jgi:C-terminal processing protease CtpA/Prc
LGVLLFSCTRDAKDEPVPDEKAEPVIEWIDNTMRTHYLWFDEIPEPAKLDYTLEPDAFFKTLLSSKDGKVKNDTHYYYSAITKKKEATKAYQGGSLSLGFEYQYYYIGDLEKYALRVLYIIPHSPASEVDIRRGDWIYEINGSPVGDDLVAQLNSGAEMRLGISDSISPVTISRQPTLSARTIEDSPVFLSKVLHAGNKKVGYLVYNHFTAGPKEDGTDVAFDNELRTVFAEFKGEEPDEFVLDLRYNGGGIVTSSRLLATMLAPESALDKVFCKLTYNSKGGDPYTFTLAKESMNNSGVQGANLNLKRLFVITGNRTASASEAVINGLKPYMEVILVGEQTEGKNVGSLVYEDDRFEWELHPIVCTLSNSLGFSDYADGFSPDYEYTEVWESTFSNLGDEEEYLLHKVLQYIATGTFPRRASLRAATGGGAIIPLGGSLDRRSVNGVILPASFGR